MERMLSLCSPPALPASFRAACWVFTDCVMALMLARAVFLAAGVRLVEEATFCRMSFCLARMVARSFWDAVCFATRSSIFCLTVAHAGVGRGGTGCVEGGGGYSTRV